MTSFARVNITPTVSVENLFSFYKFILRKRFEFYPERTTPKTYYLDLNVVAVGDYRIVRTGFYSGCIRYVVYTDVVVGHFGLVDLR